MSVGEVCVSDGSVEMAFVKLEFISRGSGRSLDIYDEALDVLGA